MYDKFKRLFLKNRLIIAGEHKMKNIYFLDSLNKSELRDYNRLKNLIREGGSITRDELNRIEYMLNSHRVLLDPPFSYYKLLIKRGVKII